MLYIDQPNTVGFSYSYPVPGYVDQSTFNIITLPNNTCPDYALESQCGTYAYPNETLVPSTTPQAAPNVWKTLQGFMGAFPQYSRNKFYFTTESYGGHYGPIFNEYFETQNAKNISGAHEIALEAVVIGNGWYDPIIQYQAYYNYTVYPGNTYDFAPFNKSIENLMYNQLYGPGNCYDLLQDCALRGIDQICSYADSFCANEVEGVYDTYAGRDEYDMRELEPDPFPPNSYVDYLNTEAVLKAIGGFTNFSDSSNVVGTAFGTTGDDGRTLQTVADMLKLIEANITVIMYTGDADYNCNWLGGQAVSQEVGAPGFDQAGYVNITTPDGVVHGQVKQSGKFAFLRIYESGHEVPFYQPQVALSMFERVVGGLDVATGTENVTSGYVTKGTPESTYREGNSTIQLSPTPPNATYSTTTNGPINSTATKRTRLSRSSQARFNKILF